MTAIRPALWTRLSRFVSKPLSEKSESLRLLRYRLKSEWYYSRVLGAFGDGSVIQDPKKLGNTRNITIGQRSLILRGAHVEPVLEYAGIRYDPQIEIGNDVYIAPDVYMVCAIRISISDGTVIGPNVYLNDTSHGIDPDDGLIIQQPLVTRSGISIGKHCFLGMRVAILPGVTLGDHCVVGINSVVNRSFPAYSMVAGAPARLIKRYSPERKEWLKVATSSASDL